MSNKRKRGLSEECGRLAEICNKATITLGELAKHIESRDQALLALVLSVPFLFLIPLPGLSTICGFIVCIVGIRIAIGKSLWLPRFLARRPFSGHLLAKILLKCKSVAKKLEKIVRPRGEFLSKHPGMLRLNGILLAITGFYLLLPLPPGTNFPPGLTSILLCLGILEEDGLMIVLGYIVFLLTTALFILLPFLGLEGFRELFH